MTTTAPPPVVATTRIPAAPVPARVVAVLVVGAETDRLGETLDSLAALELAPDGLVVVPTGDATDEALALVRDHEALHAAVPDLAVRERGPLGESTIAAVARATGTTPDGIAAAPATPRPPDGPVEPAPDAATTWWWLLRADTAPLPGALTDLLGGARRSRTVGIVGPKVVQWDDPRLLVELGHQVTRAGRRIDAPVFGEPDQGQYDQRTDVLAVGTTGMLVRRDVLDELGGLDASFTADGADLDLGWRAQLAGHRVVVAPSARVRDGSAATTSAAGPPGVGDGRDDDDLPTAWDRARLAHRASQRRAARRVALTRCAPYAVPFLAAWVAVSSVLGAALLLVLKRPAHAWLELGDLGALLHPVSGTRSRWRFRGHKRVRRGDLEPVFVGAGSAVAHTWDKVQEAVVLDRRRAERADPAAQGATESGPVAEEAEDLTVLPASLPQRIATHPGTVVVVLAALASGLFFRTALRSGVLDAEGTGLAGGELRGVSSTAAGLWHVFRDSWHGAGLGSAQDLGPGVGVLSALTWLVERVPYVAEGRSPVSVTVAWLLLAALPLSTLTAYLAGRVATRAPWPRALVALAWGTGAVLTTALSSGRVSVVIAHVLLPLVVAGYAAAATRRSTWTSVFAAALAAAVVAAFVPAYLVVTVVAGLGLVVLGPHGSARAKGLVLAVFPVALLGPWVLRFVDAPRQLLTGGGLLDLAGGDVPSWQVALGVPDGTSTLRALLLAPLVLAALVALARRSRGDGRSAALTALSVLALVGLGAALAAPRVVVGSAVGDAGTPVDATLWAGVGTDLWVAGVLAVLLTGYRGVRHLLGDSRWGGRRLALTAASVLVAAGIVGSAALVTADGLGDQVTVGQDSLPAVAVDAARGPDGSRLLVLEPVDDTLGYRLLGDEPGSLLRDVAAPTVVDPGLASLVGGLASNTLDDVTGPGLGDLLADQGVGFVSVRADATSSLARTLDAGSGLTRLGTTDGQTLWRVLPRRSAEASVTTPVPPSRVRLVDADGAVVRAVPVTGPHGAVDSRIPAGTSGRQVVFAESPEWASRARVTFDDRVLTPVSSSGLPTYVLPTGAGRLVVDLPPAHRDWFVVQMLLLAVALFLAIPFGTRRSRRLS